MQPILIVDDEVEMRIAMSETLKHCGYQVELSHNALDALKKIKDKDYSLIITDMTMPKRSGLELLKDIKQHDPAKAVIMVTAYGSIETAVEAMKYGAFDYIVKPFNFETFTFVVERALSFKETTPITATQTKRSEQATNLLSREIITQNKEMLHLLKVAKNIAKSKATVLMQSESGTGKEMISRYLHEHSDRAHRPFVAVNCAALPDSLLESELFGYKKGSFTGATQDRQGKFEQANGGTILLDEISEMDIALQAKLLRVLQEQEVDKIGGKAPIPIDIRVIATTNQDMMQRIQEGKFREDLYFRLNVIPLNLPPLRERKDDIPLLAAYFLKKHAERNAKKTPSISQQTLEIFRHYNWRGNIRELENVMERAILLCDEAQIQPKHLWMHSSISSSQIFGADPNIQSDSNKNDDDMTLKAGMSIKEAEKKLILDTLKKTHGNRTKASEMLGISIRTLRNKLNEYRIDSETESN